MKMRGVLGLFIGLIIILLINPSMIYNIYNTILGKIILLAILIFVTMNNVTLGLLVALLIIVASREFGSVVEGMDNADSDILTPKTIGVDADTTSVAPEDKINVVTADANKELIKRKVQQSENDSSSGGIDVVDSSLNVRATDSNSLPTPKSASTENVAPATEGTLTTTMTEGFCSMCASF